MDQFNIRIAAERCTGCLRCQLACSELYSKAFNPSAARILVVFSAGECTISLTDACNGCGVCVDHCFYGALEKAEREALK